MDLAVKAGGKIGELFSCFPHDPLKHGAELSAELGIFSEAKSSGGRSGGTMFLTIFLKLGMPIL